MNSIAFFEIQSSNPARDVKFYKAAFGWKFAREKSLPIEYYRIESPGMLGGLLKRPMETPPMKYGTNAFTCSIQVKDFDATAKKLLKAGAQVAMAKFAVPGRCWQGYFIDPDNNVFGIFQADKRAK